MSECDQKLNTRKPQLEIGTYWSNRTRQNLWVDMYRSGLGPPRCTGSYFWTGLGPNWLVFIGQTWTTGGLTRPVANTEQNHCNVWIPFGWQEWCGCVLKLGYLPSSSLGSAQMQPKLRFQIGQLTTTWRERIPQANTDIHRTKQLVKGNYPASGAISKASDIISPVSAKNVQWDNCVWSAGYIDMTNNNGPDHKPRQPQNTWHRPKAWMKVIDHTPGLTPRNSDSSETLSKSPNHIWGCSTRRRYPPSYGTNAEKALPQ